MDIHSSYYRNYPLHYTKRGRALHSKTRFHETDRTNEFVSIHSRGKQTNRSISISVRRFGSNISPFSRLILLLSCIGLLSMPFGCGQQDPDISAPTGVGSLTVTSIPDSASIQLDGECTGFFTPATLNDVSTGYHTVRVTKTGYSVTPESLRVEIREGQTTDAEFTLSELQARPVILESFTNVCCMPCAEANPMMYELMDQLGPEGTVLLEFHTQFPSPLDPFYLEQKTLMDTRIGQYGVSQAPWVVIEGAEGLQPSSEDALRQVIDAVDIGNDVELRLIGEATSSTVTCTLEVESAISDGTYIIHVFVTDSLIEFDEPPGTNGETEFRHVVRGVLPSPDGEDVQLSTGATETFVWSTELSWWSGEDDIRLTAIARRSGSLELVGAGLYDLP